MAGLLTDGDGWIRLVSRRSPGTLSFDQCKLHDGSQARLFDVIEVEVSRAWSVPHQPENWLIGRERWGFLDWFLGVPQWRLIEKVWPEELLPLLENFTTTGPDLFGSYGDRVSCTDFGSEPVLASLALVEPSDVFWSVEASFRGRKRIRASFQLKGQRYNLSVTDPEWEQRLSRLQYGTHQREAGGIGSKDRLFFTISLGEPFNGACYKLIAAVIVLANRVDVSGKKERPAS